MKKLQYDRNQFSFRLVLSMVLALMLPITSSGYQDSQPPEPPEPPCEATNCIPAIYSITNLVVLPLTNVCLGASLSVSNSSVSVAGTNIVIDSSCEATTNIVGHTLLTNIWIATVGSWSITNIQVPPTDEPWSFTPTNCGQGTVSLATYYLDGCDGLASSSAQKAFLVSSVDIFEPEKIVCACDTASFTLTNTCGEVTWEVQGAMNPGNPMVASNSIVAGTNCGSWNVVARSKDNTNCTDMAVLKVVGAGSLTVSGAGIPSATNSQMFTVCPVPTNAANPYVTITASPCPQMDETNLPACWQLTGGIGTNRLWRQVDRRQLGTNTITASAGCSSNKVVIIVADTIPPTISGATGFPVCTAVGSCSAVVTFGGISATDDCYLASLTISPSSGTSFTKGPHTVRVTATDLGNNATTNTFVLTVNDCEKPVIPQPPGITVCASPTGTNIVTWATPTATDNCGSATVTCNPASGYNFPVGDNPVICTATDSSGNTATKSFLVRVVKVKILTPKGSFGAATNPVASWLTTPCYHFDLQGLRSSAVASYPLQFSGQVQPNSFGYGWTLDSGAGTLSNPTTATPTHSPPPTIGSGKLTLQATSGGTNVGCSDERNLVIYRDHLGRDRSNFGTGISCGNPSNPTPSWYFTNYGAVITMGNVWNCFGSVWHAFNGTGNGWSIATVNWTNYVEETAPVNWSNITSNLSRGDVVVFYSGSPGNYQAQHTHTCLSGTTMYGANNEPAIIWHQGSPFATWKWGECNSQQYFTNVNAGASNVIVLTRVVKFKKP